MTPDAPGLLPGQLVFVETTVRARHDPDATKVLQGVHEGFSAASAALFAGAWRDGAWAQRVAAPLENVHPLDEAVLLGATLQSVVPVAQEYEVTCFHPTQQVACLGYIVGRHRWRGVLQRGHDGAGALAHLRPVRDGGADVD